MDAMGRIDPEDMSDRELLIENVKMTRVLYDAISALGSNPMVAAFLPPTLARK